MLLGHFLGDMDPHSNGTSENGGKGANNDEAKRKFDAFMSLKYVAPVSPSVAVISFEWHFSNLALA